LKSPYAKYYSAPLLTCLSECQIGLGLKADAIASMDDLIARYEAGPESPEALNARV
jgi:hypothetical protein